MAACQRNAGDENNVHLNFSEMGIKIEIYPEETFDPSEHS